MAPKRRFIIPVFTIAVLVSSLMPNSFAANLMQNCAAVSGNYVVSFNNGVSVAKELENVDGKKVTPLHSYSLALNGFSGSLSAGQVCDLQERASVEFIEQDQVVKADSLQVENPATWGISRIDSPNIIDSTYTYSLTGMGVTAYVVDTGINTRSERPHS